MPGKLESKGVENITISWDKKDLKLSVDLTQKGKESSTGKSITIASSKGKYKIPGTDMFLMFNLFIPKKASKSKKTAKK